MSTQTPLDDDFEQRLSRVEPLLEELSRAADPKLAPLAREVLATVLELHGRGLARMLAACDEQTRRELARDAGISAMLLLHDLHPLSLETRVTDALEGLRKRHRGKLEDVTVDAQQRRITVRVVPVTGTCNSTGALLQKEFEEALLSVAPDAETISVELTKPAPALVTLRLHRPMSDQPRNQEPR